jgi:hypothetical protein
MAILEYSRIMVNDAIVAMRKAYDVDFELLQLPLFSFMRICRYSPGALLLTSDAQR